MRSLQELAQESFDDLSLYVRSACRVGLYGGMAGLARRAVSSQLAVDGRIQARHQRDAFRLHVNTLKNPAAAAALWQAEREDLRDLPTFLLHVPADLWRLRNAGRAPDRKVVADDGYPYPSYYLNAFHNQRNGGLSRISAATYEWQIRFLFLGTNRLMRQSVIDAIPVGDQLQILDVGCGTGDWIAMAQAQGRRHSVCGIDLSPDYLQVARNRQTPGSQFLQMNAEEMPLHWKNRFDIVTCIWLHHELPAAARDNVTREIGRVLKPGGSVVILEAVQAPDLDAEEAADAAQQSDSFSSTFNEPHFLSYQQMDWSQHLLQHGLTVTDVHRCYASKRIVAQPSCVD